MHRIIRKKHLTAEICLVEFEAPDVAVSARAGQFVILRIDEKGERFPLTLYDFDRQKGTVTVVCQAVGVSTRKLCALDRNEAILDAVGPLGHAVNTDNIDRAIVVGGGVGTAEAYPIAKAMREKGNDVTAIIGSRNKDLVICEEEMGKICKNVLVSTDDGSYGRKGFVTDILKELLDNGKYDLVFAIGPLPMMKAVSELTKKYGVRTLVSLNSIMIDGTGMCGGCRVRYDGKMKFTCVDGPEFDAHLVDFEELTLRQTRYKDKEALALEHYEKNCVLGRR